MDMENGNKNELVLSDIDNSKDLELKDLDQFYGTENYYDVMGVKITDGVAYIMKKGYSWFVTDSIVTILMKLKKEPFLAVKLYLTGTKGKVVITDGNTKELYRQNYPYTDAKRELKLYYTNGVLMLDNEY